MNLLRCQSTIFSCISKRGAWHLILSPWYECPQISHYPRSPLHNINPSEHEDWALSPPCSSHIDPENVKGYRGSIKAFLTVCKFGGEGC